MKKYILVIGLISCAFIADATSRQRTRQNDRQTISTRQDAPRGKQANIERYNNDRSNSARQRRDVDRRNYTNADNDMSRLFDEGYDNDTSRRPNNNRGSNNATRSCRQRCDMI